MTYREKDIAYENGRVSKGMGAARALDVLLTRMEQHWKDEQL